MFSFVFLIITSCQFAPKVLDSNSSQQIINSAQLQNCTVLPATVDSQAERNPALANQCIDLFKSNSTLTKQTDLNSKKVTEPELLNFTSQKVTSVTEFQFIRAEAKKLGIRVWMFGGTASSFLHYAKWDLARQKGQLDLQADRFDYDFTNIFRSTQDLDIVIDGTVDQIQTFQRILENRFQYFMGSKKAWEVRSLRFQIGTPGAGYFKEALLNDPNFSDQNTDTNSLAMVEISESKDPVVRDLRSWNKHTDQIFLTDAVNDTISYLRNPKHFQTARAKMGENPEILSVLRLLVKAFQYDLSIDPKSMRDMQAVIKEFDPRAVTNQNALRRINETASKLIMHSNNIENAIDTLDKLGLRQKLVSMNLRGQDNLDASYWLSKEPLRSFEIPKDKNVTQLPKYTSGLLKNYNFHPTGRTAKDLGITIVAHETNNMLAYESITRSHSGEPNVLISRANSQGEAAVYGDGFYTATGRQGARGTGLTIRFTVDPNAREGVDFTNHGNYIVWLNKKSLKIIQESLNLGLEQLVDLVQGGKFQLDGTDRAVAEKFKRRLNQEKILTELEKFMNSPKPSDQKKFEEIFSVLLTNTTIKNLVSEQTISSVLKSIYPKISELKDSKNEIDVIKYITQTAPMIEQLQTAGLSSKNSFRDYLVKTADNKKLSFDLRKTALFEDGLLKEPENFLSNLDLSSFTLIEKDLISKEIRSFGKSKDVRRQAVATVLDLRKNKALESDDPSKLKALFELKLVDLNERNISGFSLLLEATYYQSQKIIDSIIADKNYDFTKKDQHGYTDVERLRLLGKSELADLIEKKRPEAKSNKKIVVKERNTDGTPIIDSVRVEPGTFKMGDVGKEVTVTLDKAFEVMSVDTTQLMWKGIADLSEQYLKNKYQINKAPSKYKGENRPVEQVSHDDIMQNWLPAINELSKTDHPELQKRLTELFPGHYKGKVYRLLTEAEYEYLAKQSGLATGKYTHGPNENNITDHAVFNQNSGGKTAEVGTKKPIFVNGKAVYDIIGNVWKWVQDSWDGNAPLTGGLNPLSTTGSDRVARGGSFYYFADGLQSGIRGRGRPGDRGNDLGFRLASDIP
jgi:formylglycine-generating enzyme required for sulfatase activity